MKKDSVMKQAVLAGCLVAFGFALEAVAGTNVRVLVGKGHGVLFEARESCMAALTDKTRVGNATLLVAADCLRKGETIQVILETRSRKHVFWAEPVNVGFGERDMARIAIPVSLEKLKANKIDPFKSSELRPWIGGRDSTQKKLQNGAELCSVEFHRRACVYSKPYAVSVGKRAACFESGAKALEAVGRLGAEGKCEIDEGTELTRLLPECAIQVGGSDREGLRCPDLYPVMITIGGSGLNSFYPYKLRKGNLGCFQSRASAEKVIDELRADGTCSSRND